MPKKIAAFGELLWDLLPNGRVLGGAPANFIYRINSFGDYGTLLSKVGEPIRLAGKPENPFYDLVFPTKTSKPITNFRQVQ